MPAPYTVPYSYDQAIGRTPPGPPGAPAPSLAPGPVYGYASPYGGVPSVPSTQATQQTAVGGNVAALGGLTDLAGKVNAFNAAQAAGQYQANLPFYNQANQQLGQNIYDASRGILPQSFINQLNQGAAERGTALGLSGSPNEQAALMRALGTNVLARQDLAQNQFTQAVGRTPTAQLYYPQSGFVTPGEQQAAQWLANLLGAAPIPRDAAEANLAALLGGLRSGQGQFPGPGTAPTQSQDLVSSIMQKYQPGGTPSPTPFAPGGVDPNAIATTSSTDPNSPNFDPTDPNVSQEDVMTWLNTQQLPEDQSVAESFYPSDTTAPTD